MSEKKYDVVVVGAGPAGSVAAWRAAENGANTLLIDKFKLPRFKLCGGAVAGWIMKKFDVPEEVVENRGVEMIMCRPPKYKKEKFPTPTPQGLVCRSKFDYWLTEHALNAGVELLDETRVLKVLKEGDTVKGIELENGEKIKSDIVIACDGATSRIARTAGFWEKWFKGGETWKDYMAFCVGLEMRLDKDLINERFGEGHIWFFLGKKVAPLGYGWVFPKTKIDILSVGLGTFMPTLEKKPTEYIKYFVTEHPIASEMLADAEIVKSCGAYIPYRKAFRPSYANGIMVAGDSAGMVNPINGEGIFYAMRAGQIAGRTAAEAVKEKDFSAKFLKRYEDQWEDKIGKHLDKQAEILQENVGATLKKFEEENITDPDERDKLFTKSFMEAFIGFIQYHTEYAFKKRGIT